MRNAIVRPADPLRNRPAAIRRQAPDGLVDATLVWIICGSYLGLLGAVSPLMMMSGGLALILLRPRSYVIFIRAWPLLLVAAIAPASALWSAEPGISLRYGFQVSLTVLIVMLAAGIAGERRLLRAVFIATAIFLALSIMSGRQGQSQGGYVLIGLTGSKNAMGALCLVVIASSVCEFFSKDEHKLLKFMAIPVGVIGLVVLLHGFATGALLGTIIFMFIAVALAFASRLTMSAKVCFGAVLGLLLLPLALVRNDLTAMWNDFLINVLHKDPGLTGRDYLWTHADRLIADQPLLGHGFRSIWLGGSSESIGLLRWAGLSTGLGFNFHNTFREILVEFGFVGAAVIFGALGVGFARLLLRSMSQPTSAALIYFVAMGLVMIVRSNVETLFGAFGDSSIFVIGISTLGYLVTSGANLPAQSAAPTRQRRFVKRTLPDAGGFSGASNNAETPLQPPAHHFRPRLS